MRWLIAAVRLAACAAIIVIATSDGARAVSDMSVCHLSISAITMPMAPNAPIRESRMMRNTSAGVRPPPNASQQSARPSSCRAPVSSRVADIDKSMATPGGTQIMGLGTNPARHWQAREITERGESITAFRAQTGPYYCLMQVTTIALLFLARIKVLAHDFIFICLRLLLF